MWNQRAICSWATFLAVGGAIGGTIAYGAYHRSDLYRRRIENGLKEFFGLPIDVASIGPHTFTARRLTEVEIWLPQRRARIFHCPQVIWDTHGIEGGKGTVLQVSKATLCIGSEQWESQDYMHVLRASLRHNFDELDIRKVQFLNTRLTWPRRDFQLNAANVNGNVLFDRAGLGKAELTCYSLNDIEVAEPIRITARIDPESEDFLPEVILEVPPLPLTALGLDHVLQSPVTQGSFAGRITLNQCPDGDEIRLTGFAHQVEISEFTTHIPGGPVPALVNFHISDALIRDRSLAHISFNGEIRRLDVDSLLGRFGLPALGGEIDLTVYTGEVWDNRIRRLSMAGEWHGASPDALIHAFWGKTGLQGRLSIRVNTLVVEDNELVGGDVDLIVEPPADRSGTIDRTLLLNLIQEQLGLALPAELLPAEVEYVQLGAKLVISRTHLRVLSLPGPAGPAIITARILGKDVPLLGKIDKTFDIDPLIQQTRGRVSGIKYKWPKDLVPSPTSTPSEHPSRNP